MIYASVLEYSRKYRRNLSLGGGPLLWKHIYIKWASPIPPTPLRRRGVLHECELAPQTCYANSLEICAQRAAADTTWDDGFVALRCISRAGGQRALRPDNPQSEASGPCRQDRFVPVVLVSPLRPVKRLTPLPQVRTARQQTPPRTDRFVSLVLVPLVRGSQKFDAPPFNEASGAPPGNEDLGPSVEGVGEGKLKLTCLMTPLKGVG